MKRILIFGGLLFFMCVELVGCYQDVIIPPVAHGSTPAVRKL